MRRRRDAATLAFVEEQRAYADAASAPGWASASTGMGARGGRSDPERDSPERMREYGEARGVDFDTWSFLTGPKPTIDDVLERYGVGSVPDEGGEIQHVVVSFLIDREGQIRKRYFGLSHDADEFLRDLERAAES
jgi:cytochrome oxidase Cu insertion factor (SCO1/SenC/PrrC family)